jgi:hypothetical protein
LNDLPGVHEHDPSLNTTNVYRGNLYLTTTPSTGQFFNTL